ncbi:MAG: sodium/proline symporter PutP [Bacillota bacterium]|nr:sodium/proline symporter PutP [Bacillota bacterium]
MDASQVQILIAMIAYMLLIVGIGVYFFRRANRSPADYFLGGRSLGPWITAMSAEASDMSGWLLMGLPGVAYWLGLSDAFWTAIGLAIGTYLNWLLVSRRLRGYSEIAGDSFTLPEFFSKRFHEKRPILLSLSALFILVFFVVYAASCFVTVGRLFSTLFGISYVSAMVIGAIFVVIYTLIGGFLAESASDFVQSIVMIVALVVVFGTGLHFSGGIGQVTENLRQFPGFLAFMGIAQPVLEDGVQTATNGVPNFAPQAGDYGFLTILSTLSWGLGYFGMPQVLLRFMAIRRPHELVRSRRIAMVWVTISLFAAVAIGLIGRSIFPTALNTAAAAETIFIHMATSFMPAFLAGIVMAGILAATISSSDSYLLIASSAVAKNIYHDIFRRDASDRQVMWVSRIALIIITLLGMVIALDENSVIFQVVSFAWAGFGATFGPLVLFSLFWKRTTHAGAVAGMLTGGIMVFVWKLAIRPMGGVFGIYELLPAFILSSIVIVVVSLITPEPSAAIAAEFDAALEHSRHDPSAM